MKKTLFTFLLLSLLFFLWVDFVFAVNYDLEIPLIQNQTTVSSIGEYIKMFFMFGLGVIGIVALFAAVWGGITYLTSGSSETRKLEGKRWLYAAASGIILLFFSYLIFTTLADSQFISLKDPSLEQISVSAVSQNSGSSASPYNLEMPLGETNQAPTNPGDYIKTFFTFGLGGVGLVALFVVIFGGIYYLISAGNAAMKTYGKQWVIAAISGLSLLLCSYLILNTINPQLVNWNQKSPDTISISINSSISSSGSSASPYNLEMPLGETNQAPTNPGDYIKTFFTFGLGGVGLVALFVVIFGGLNYIFSGSSQTRAMEGKRWITSAIAGTALLLTSFLMLNTLNSNLTSSKAPVLETITIDLPEDPKALSPYTPGGVPLPTSPIPGGELPANLAALKANELSQILTYEYGGDPTTGRTDCSGAAERLRIEVGGHDPGRSTQAMLNEARESGNFSMDLNNLQPGDIIIRTARVESGMHAGTYIGNGLVWNSIPNKGFSIETLNSYMTRANGVLLGINKFH